MAGNWCRAALTAATATLALARFEPSFERGQPSAPLSLERSNEIFETFLSRYYTLASRASSRGTISSIRLATSLRASRSRNLLRNYNFFIPVERKSIALPIIRKFFGIEF